MAVGEFWVGLDLGHESISVCVVDNSGAVLREQDCATSLADVVESLAPFPMASIGLIAVEAGAATHIVRKLRDRGFPVGIFDARKARRFLAIRRNKTDCGDARGLADMARLGQHTVSQVYLKSLECQEIRSQIVLRHRAVKVRVSLEAGLRSRLRLFGRLVEMPSGNRPVRKRVEAEVAAIREEDGFDLWPELEPLVAVCDSLRAFIADADKQIERRAHAHPVCRLLMEVPGVGALSALSFYSAIEDPHRFKRNSDVGAYLGLVPRRYQSGDNNRTLGITKSGNKLTRSHLATAALILRSRGRDCALKEWGLQLKDRIGSSRSRVALARKLAIVLLAMWKTNTPFEAYPPRGTRIPKG
ncbi:IS110 family transposase [Sphingosinicella terrae]|uniref:IS110 family transposase n=1 Tax=Sphingosinicella terrae TaxID=2172047 RepID=UPI000E0DD0F2|nr:IS110 family transposase [Sphingosinicella terrae]